MVEQLEDLNQLRSRIVAERRMVDAVKLFDQALHANLVGDGKKSVASYTEVDPELVDQAIAKRTLMLQRARTLREVNPMLGHRGVRLSITYPEIYRMQIQAILEAAAECVKQGVEVHPEIMIPQVAIDKELEWVKKIVDGVVTQVQDAYNVKLDFKYGTMVEAVRACVTAGDVAKIAEFFSFGKNDLTQATFSFSREDAENKFLPYYEEKGIIPVNPFESLDTKGVGALMRTAVEQGRDTRPDLKIGICGEHGGHPASILFCHQVGLDYVSCSAPRVPIARLAAAHANLQ